MFENLLLTMIVILSLVLIRNHVAFNARMKALQMVSELAQKDINSGREDWRRHYSKYEELSYESIMFNIFIWTPEQAYPWLYATSPKP